MDQKQREEAFWARSAEGYEEKGERVLGKDVNEAIRLRLARFSDLGETLELGCGPGTFSEIVAKRSRSLVSTDFSPAMVAKARQRLEASGILVERADCCALRFADASFDTVFMANALHAIPEPGRAVAEARRVLRPGGRFVVVSYTLDGLSFLGRMAFLYRFVTSFGRPPLRPARLDLGRARELLTAGWFKVDEAEMLGKGPKALLVTAIKPEVQQH